jgi:hypothetical protein
MSAQPQKLSALIGDRPSSQKFTPQTYLCKNGTVGRGVRVLGAYNTISVETASVILEDVAGFEQACIVAVQMSQRPNEAQRLAALKAAKGGAPSAAAAAKKSALSEMIAQLPS